MEMDKLIRRIRHRMVSALESTCWGDGAGGGEGPSSQNRTDIGRDDITLEFQTD